MTARRPGPGDVRPLTVTDVARVVALEHELFGRSAWSEVMVREELAGPGRWYVGLDADAVGLGPWATAEPARQALVPGSKLVAYAGSWFDGEVSQVMTIGVAPAAQRSGAGSVLLAALVGHARHLGARSVMLEVRVDNEPAIALYEGFGFTVLGRRPRYYQPEDVDAFTMRLVLADDA